MDCANEQKKLVYWSNTVKPTEINLNGLDLQHGVFIKIGDRSDGGGAEVFYAKNKSEILAITAKLYKQCLSSNDPYKKHIYIIEPAFITLRKYQDKEFNVTGRAFVNIVYDRVSQSVDVQIAAAKWMFPENPVSAVYTEEQMLSNVKHSLGMVPLIAEKLTILQSGIKRTYSEIFKTAMLNHDLLAYFNGHPYMRPLRLCLRPNAAYLMMLPHFYAFSSSIIQTNGMTQDFLLLSLLFSNVQRDYLQRFNNTMLLSSSAVLSSGLQFFEKILTPEEIIKRVSILSFFENFIAHVKTLNSESYLSTFRYLESLLPQENDLNRALRQATNQGNLVAAKLLIYTRRADVNALSPSNKTALDYATTCQDEKSKDLIVRMLEGLEAKLGAKLAQSSDSAIALAM